MLTFKNGSDTAIIVLHEIYGINKHITEVCQKYSADGFDVFCPDLLCLSEPFDYYRQNEAYEHFTKNIGFDVYLKVNWLIEQIRPDYEKIILLGFSIGATIAWRCTADGICDGMIGCYGSRIRDYFDLTPECPTLLIFARDEQSFNPNSIEELLQGKVHTIINIIDGEHGFCDPYSNNYNFESATTANKLIDEFLN